MSLNSDEISRQRQRVIQAISNKTAIVDTQVIGKYEFSDGLTYEVYLLPIGKKQTQLMLKCLNCPCKTEPIPTEAGYIQRLIDFKTIDKLKQ